MHYKRLRRHGDIDRDPLSAAERFAQSFVRRESCWEWQGARDKDGYGVFTDYALTRSPIRAHRYAWYLVHGVMPDEHVCHRCDNPPCVNPEHLFLGSNDANVRDKVSKGRARGNQTGNLGALRRRLTDEQVGEIRDAIGSHNAVGRQYGVSGEHVRRIRNGTRR